MTALTAGLVAGYGIAIPVGAIGVYLVDLTARTSWRVGAAAAMGVATADGVYAVLAATAGSTLTPLLTPVTTPLKWASAAALLMLACWTAVRAVRHYRSADSPLPATEPTAGRAYATLLGLTLLNPATIVYFTALVLGDRPANGTVYAAAAFAASASWQLLLAVGGALLGRTLTGPRGRLSTALLSSTVILVLAVRIL
ncbi:LysE family transporter [Amycolatopsis benzoatilytica]|uniref:LysE family transporter n=1 Tax=Amycolatopsis benzoatilytica TaxID=346045 RepID=UPI00036CB908|nr:LysE family transporter [Amycolatopsis benzoatilytica]